MRCEYTCTMNSWRNGPGHYNTVFVTTDPSLEGMRGLDVTHVQLFFSCSHDGIKYLCALVHWFSCVGNLPDVHTGMWVVKPGMLDDDDDLISIIHLDTIVRVCRLIPVFGRQRVSRALSFTDTLDTFTHFYVNK